ncbi:early nodulin-like protein 2 [Glycine soja]|uniref:early nodulin-like protein 2 n=1 Tax=Glycine soja TaxID=3848 RepID=UPI0010408726|nr:early nodulin-like protein 2 [Glycine soja]
MYVCIRYCYRPYTFNRFVLAAVELNGAIYATGGFDGNDYLRYALGGFDGDKMVPSSSLSPSPPQATAPKAYPPTTSSAPPPTTTTPPPLAPAPVSKTTLASSPPSTTPSSSSSFGPTASSPSNSPTDSPPALVSPSDSPVTSSPVVVSDGPADAPTLQLQICLRGLKGYGEKQSGEEATHFKCRFAYPSDGMRKVVYGFQVTDEEVESLNKRLNRKL